MLSTFKIRFVICDRSLDQEYFIFQCAPMLLTDGNRAIYPLAKDCLEGIRDPQWLDLPPLHCVALGTQSLPHALPNSKSKASVIALALEVCQR